MDREQVAGWVAAYERAWRAPGTAALAGLFTADAAYRQGAVRGRRPLTAAADHGLDRGR